MGDCQRRYFRLTKADRVSIERGLDSRASCREIARGIGRSCSTAHDEVLRNRVVTRGPGRGGRVGEVPDDACPRLLSWPHACNGCRYRRYHCSRRWRCEYSASRAQALADETLSASRRGVDMGREDFERAVALIRADLARGMSPEQVCAARAGEVGVSASTVRRWIAEGYAGMTNLELRRQVGYRPRRRRGQAAETPHGPRRSYAAFCALGEEARASACEMDCVVGLARDEGCLLTLYLRPCRFQMAIPLPSRTRGEVARALDGLERAVGAEAFGRLFGTVLTDNGPEFSDPDAIERSALGGGGRCRVHYCDVRQSQQKGGCERNHVELRKILPKGRGISFDSLDRRDCAVLMSHLNSEPRPSLMGSTPIAVLRAAAPAAAAALLDAYGVEELPYGEVVMSPAAIDADRAARGLAPLA